MMYLGLFRFFARYCCTNDLSKDLEELKKLEIIDASNLEYIANMAGIVVQETDTDEVSLNSIQILESYY